MRRNYPLLAGLALVTIVLSPITASAAQTAPNPSLISDTSTVQTVQYWGDRYRDRGWGYEPRRGNLVDLFGRHARWSRREALTNQVDMAPQVVQLV